MFTVQLHVGCGVSVWGLALLAILFNYLQHILEMLIWSGSVQKVCWQFDSSLCAIVCHIHSCNIGCTSNVCCIRLPFTDWKMKEWYIQLQQVYCEPEVYSIQFTQPCSHADGNRRKFRLSPTSTEPIKWCLQSGLLNVEQSISKCSAFHLRNVVTKQREWNYFCCEVPKMSIQSQCFWLSNVLVNHLKLNEALVELQVIPWCIHCFCMSTTRCHRRM